MKEYDELFAVFASRDYKVRFLKAKALGTCIVCLKPAARFLSASAVMEYRVSALCQECQDRYLSGKRSFRNAAA